MLPHSSYLTSDHRSPLTETAPSQSLAGNRAHPIRSHQQRVYLAVRTDIAPDKRPTIVKTLAQMVRDSVLRFIVGLPDLFQDWICPWTSARRGISV